MTEFTGDWDFRRQISDAKHGQNGAVTGQATFERGGNGLHYRETGVLTLANGAQMQAERSYLWSPDGAGIAVTFADGAAFHRFDPQGQAQGTSHLCGDDLYNVTYDFTRWPVWTAVWAVVGPRKDYISTTHYIRA